jgi:hypothetical protein
MCDGIIKGNAPFEFLPPIRLRIRADEGRERLHAFFAKSACVPEVPIHEYGYTLARENDVRLPGYVAPVKSEAKPSPVQC